jgi:glutaminyl-peptide cyclotransferase
MKNLKSYILKVRTPALLLLLLAAACAAPVEPLATRQPTLPPVGETAAPALTQTSPPPAQPSPTAAAPEPTSTHPTRPFETAPPAGERFEGERALSHVETQLSFGPRIPGTPGHDRIVEYMLSELEQAGWEGKVQEGEYLSQPIRNVIGSKPAAGSRPDASGRPWIILGAHYDSRMWADADPDPANHQQPVPGANDGASGVAVLLELARVLPEDLNLDVWLVFFDAEDNGRIPEWDWILGSRFFAESLEHYPNAVVIVDMIGDADLNIYYESSSDPALMQQIWSTAASLGYDQFIPEYKYHILDDHTPFLELGIPAVDIIDFDYPYWHTLEDTLDKVSAESLEAVGRTLQAWLESQ